jgi:catechol 2,3-dioxygenase-like lactoylglutathione lyase family enzyme
MSILFTRREALAMIAAAPAAAFSAQASQLPLRTSGLEHVGFTVPDPQKSAAFYGRIFDPQIFQEMMPPLRYYCRLGIGYVAFGPNPNANPNAAARIDHFCATVEDYRLEDMRAELKTHGLNLAGAPGFNAVTDPDGIRMQFMATPGGLLPTIIPSTRVTQDDAICEAVGLDHVVLQVFRHGDFQRPDARAHLVHRRAHTSGVGEDGRRSDAAHRSLRHSCGGIRPEGRHPQTGRDRRRGAAVCR